MKITPEIEAVARAIYEKRNGVGTAPFSQKPIAHKEPYYLDAVAALKAIRIPTERQKEKGIELSWLYNFNEEETYTAMIDVALGGANK